MHRTSLQYLDDIMEAISNIEDDTRGISFDEFVADRRRKDAVIRNFEVIGEAIKNLPDNLKEQYPDIDWRKIAGFHDVLSHAYLGIKATILWDNSMNKLPVRKGEIQQIIRIEETRQ